MRDFNLLLFVLICNIALSQNRIEYRFNAIRLTIFTETNKFTLKDKPDYYRDEYTDSLKAATVITGKVVNKNRMISLVDSSSSKLIIQLKKIDKYRVLVTNKNRYFKYKSILCPDALYFNNGKWIQSMSWENGIKQGTWSYQTIDGYKYEVYEKGKLIKKYFQTYKQLMDSIKNLPDNSDLL